MATSIKNIIKLTTPYIERAENLWKTKKFDESKFPEIAEQILNEIPSIQLPSLESITRELIKLPLPAQNFTHKEFSDLPITLIRREKLCLDLYWWTDTDTSIHNHHFTGAFKIIHGSSFQIVYIFKKSKIINGDLQIGELLKHGNQVLEPNAVFPIKHMDAFIHQVFHQSNTTVTLCLRTLPNTDKSLSGFLYPNLKIRLKKFEPSIVKYMIGLGLLLNEGKKIKWELKKEEMIVMHYNIVNNRLPNSPKFTAWLEKELKKENLGKIYLKNLKAQPLYHRKMAEFIAL